MRKEISKRLLNVFLRGLSMAGRFILIFSIAKLLTPAEVGVFGLMLATISFSVLLVGADYYAYAQRELLARPPELWSFVIQNQIKAQLILYCVLLPAQLVIFFYGLMDWQYASWFFALLLLEHIAQEINRLLVIMHKQFMASWVLFVRMASWVFFVIPLMVLYPEYQNLKTLYAAWLIGCAAAIVIGLIAVKKTVPIWCWQPTDKIWLKKGFMVGGSFLLASISMKGLLTFDRYAVEALGNPDLLGVYVFYIGIVTGLYSVLDPAVFSFLYPRMLSSYQMHRKDEYQKAFKELMWSTLIISLLLAVFIWIITPYIINWIDKPIYTEHLESFGLLIFAGFMYAIGYIPHYALYAMKADKWIMSAHITSLVIFFMGVTMLHLESGIQTVSIAMILAFSWMAIVKSVGYLYTKQQSYLNKGLVNT